VISLLFFGKNFFCVASNSGSILSFMAFLELS
jgi:hypothetical protein